MKSKKIKVDPSDDDFETICICAIRYSLGRETYMPTLVQGFIRPLLPYFDIRTLKILEKDISNPHIFGGYGNEEIDKPSWILFLNDIRTELKIKETQV